jgi:membrane protein
MVSAASQEETLFGLIADKLRSREDIDNSSGRLNSGQYRVLTVHRVRKYMVSTSASPRNVESHSIETGPAGNSASGNEQRPQVAAGCGLRLFLRPKAISGLLKAAYSEWNKDNAPRMGAALAYYTIFSLAPLLIIAVAIAGLAFGTEAARGEIARQIQRLVGPDGARAIQEMIQSGHKPVHGVIGGMIGIIALFLGASGVFCEIEDALNSIWHVNPSGETGIRNLVKARFLSFGMVLGIGFLLLVSLLLSALLAAATKYMGDMLPVPVVVFESLDVLLSLFFITVLFAMLFKFLPHTKIAWSDVWIGAALTSLLFTAGKFVIGFYIGKSVSASAYGAAGSLVVLVAWIYYAALILYFGAEFTCVYANKLGSRRGQYAT